MLTCLRAYILTRLHAYSHICLHTCTHACFRAYMRICLSTRRSYATNRSRSVHDSAPKTHIPFLPKEEGMMRPEVMMSPDAIGCQVEETWLPDVGKDMSTPRAANRSTPGVGKETPEAILGDKRRAAWCCQSSMAQQTPVTRQRWWHGVARGRHECGKDPPTAGMR